MVKKVVLKSIELSNFRGQSRKVEFVNKETKISGRNSCGKTTIFNAWLWLLTGYTDPSNVKNFNLFDNRHEISKDTPKASVKAVLEIDGYEYSIEKTAEAKFVRRRGSDAYEKASSDTYTIKLDNIEIGSSDFSEWVSSNICKVDMLPYCLDGHFFTEILDDKNKARNILEMLIGEVNREDMNGDYSSIEEDMKRFSIEQIEERLKYELKPLKARMQEIPAIIDSKQKTLSEYSRIDFEQIAADIKKKREEIQEIDNRILGSGQLLQPIIGQRDAIFDLINVKTFELNQKKSEYLFAENAKQNAILAKIRYIEQNNQIANSMNNSLLKEPKVKEESLEKLTNELKRLNERRDSLLKYRDEVKSRVFNGDKCSYCGAALPYEVQEEARVKFNEQRNKDLEDIVTRGKNNNDEIDKTKILIENITNELKKPLTLYEEQDTEQLRDELKELKSSFVQYEDTDEYKKLAKEIEDLKESMPELPNNDCESLTSAKRVFMDALDELNQQYGLKFKVDSINREIQELRDEQKEVGVSIAKVEGKIDKCREFKQEKADIVSYRVNDKLNICSIDMWSTQKDGTNIPDVVLKGREGVKFGSLNFSEQIKVRMEIQSLFMSRNNVELPVFIDEYSVFSEDNRPCVDGQSVCLFATNTPYLTIE